jgi:hypothetical protein
LRLIIKNVFSLVPGQDMNSLNLRTEFVGYQRIFTHHRGRDRRVWRNCGKIIGRENRRKLGQIPAFFFRHWVHMKPAGFEVETPGCKALV